MPEIATAWVTLSATTRGMEADIRRAVDRAGQSARLNPRVDSSGMRSGAMSAGRAWANLFNNSAQLNPEVDTSSLARSGEDAGAEFGDGFVNTAKAALAALAAATVGAGIIDQFRRVLEVGSEWTNSLNTLQAVTGATTDQLEAAGTAARALGNDITLPATSANDASAAMTELAKGGLTLSESMNAAKGSLQLAAAAHVDAAQAATIQANALAVFRLKGTDAGHVADLLANGANSATGEIGDMAYALQAGSSVAAGMGISIEDTVTALSLLAKNAIIGSDAGTLLKSSLLALQSPSDQAAGALDKLGVVAYDSQGNFVGLPKIFEELRTAQQRLTPEMYQWATSTAFGSDAARLAAIAGLEGAEGFNQMSQSVTRAGGAADVAAAKTRGLPGAWERVKNAIESLQLQAYDKLEGPVTLIADRMSSALSQVPDRITQAWDALRVNPILVSTFEGTVTAFKGLAGAAKEVWPSLVQVGQSLAMASAALGVGAWQLFNVAMTSAAGMLNAIAPALSTIAEFMRDHQSVVIAAAGAWLLFRTVPALMGRLATAVSPVTRALNTVTGSAGSAAGAFRGFTQQMRLQQALARMGGQSIGVMGAAWATVQAQASGAMGAIRTRMSNLVANLGGGLNVGLMAAAAAFAIISAKNQQAEQTMKAYEEAVRNTDQAQVSLNEALERSGGAFDDQSRSAALDRISAIKTELEAASQRTGSFLDQFRDAQGSLAGGFKAQIFSLGDDPSSNLNTKIEQEADAAKAAQQAINDLKLSQQSLTDVAYGGQDAFDAMVAKLEAAGDAGHKAADMLRQARKEFQDSEAAAKNLTPGFTAIKDAIETIANASSSAADKTNAFKSALDVLAGVQPNIQQATDSYNTTIRQIAETTAEAVDKTKGFGDALVAANGTVNTTTENGHALFYAMSQIKDSTLAVAGAGGDLKGALAGNDAQLQALANKFGLTKAQVDAMAASMAYVPARIETLFATQGADETTKQIALINTKLSTVPPGKSITVDALTKEAEDKLKSVGIKVQDINVNGHAQVEITAPDGTALQQLQDILNKIAQINSATAVIKTAREERVPLAALPGQGGGVPPRANGAIVPMVSGGFRQIAKPGMADIYAGRGAGTIFAEEETGGEAYIPLAPGKRSRSMAILSEVARLFGMNAHAVGGAIAGAGSGTSDSIPALLSNGEHVWTAAEVAKAGGQAAMYRMRAAVMAGYAGGGEIKTGAVFYPFEPPKGKIDRTQPGGRPDLAPGFGGAIALPDWGTPGQKFGPPPGDWWTRPINPDDVLFPDAVPPGQRKRQQEIWDKLHPRVKPLRFAQGGAVTTDSIKEYAAQISGGTYVRGGPPGLDGTDCSGAQAAMANFITGGSGRFSTADEASALLSRGFMQGDPPAGVAAYWIGWKNGGEGGGHTAGTIVDPDGGSVNVEMGGANGGGAFGAGAQGASAFPNRAWIQVAGGEDPNATSSFSGGSSAAVQSASASVTRAKASVTSAQASADQASAAVAEAKAKGASADKIAILEKKEEAAQGRLTAAQERQAASETKLSEVKEKAANGSDKKSGGMDASSLGQSFVSGIFETLGLPNFMNLLDTPNVKSAMAVANFGLGLLGGGTDDGSGGVLGGAAGGLGLPNFTNLLNPNGPQALTPNGLGGGLGSNQHHGSGALPGPAVVVNGNVGMDPKAFTDRVSAGRNAAYRKSGLPAVRPT